MPVALCIHMQDFCFNSKVVRSLVLDALRRGAHNYWKLWREWYSMVCTVRKDYVEHMSCHVAIDAFSQRNSEHNQHLATCRMSGIPIVNVLQGHLVLWVPYAHRVKNPNILTASTC